MSKFLLWAGFILSIFFLLTAAGSVLSGNTQNIKAWAVLLWIVIFLGSGYKLVLAKANR